MELLCRVTPAGLLTPVCLAFLRCRRCGEGTCRGQWRAGHRGAGLWTEVGVKRRRDKIFAIKRWIKRYAGKKYKNTEKFVTVAYN